MAGELTIQGELRVNLVTGGLTPLTLKTRSVTVDQTNKQKVSGTLSLTTSPASIDLTALTAKGWAFFHNTGDTNDAVVMADTQDAIRIPPGLGYPVCLDDASAYTAKSAASTTTLVFECYAQ